MSVESEMVPSNSQLSYGRRLILLVFVVTLSVVLPALILIGSVSSAFSGWRLGLVMVEQHRTSAGTVKNGELWYPATKYLQSTYSPPCESRIVRVDLKTGEHRETGLILPIVARLWEEFDLLWNAEDLYVVDRFASVPIVYRANEKGLEQFAVMSSKDPASAFMHAPFFHHGVLTVVEQTIDGEFRLARFIDGKWEQGRRVRLLETSSQWVDSPNGPRIWRDPEVRLKRNYTFLAVVPEDGDLHIRFVIVAPGNQTIFAAYRKGFEFVDDNEACSALAPENIELDASGWEQINSSADSALGGGPFSCEHGRVLMGILDDGKTRFVRRELDGQWKVLSGLEPSAREFEWDSLITGPSEHTFVLRQSNEWWGKFIFYPVDGDRIGPATLTLPGDEQKYLNRWGRFAGGLSLAWIVHVLVLIGGQQLGNRRTNEYEFGTQKELLPPTWLRGLAFLVDTTVIMLVVAISLSIHWSWLGVKWDRNANRKISRLISNAEMNVQTSPKALWGSTLNVLDCISDPNEFLGHPHDSGELRRLILLVFIDTFLPLWLYQTYNESKTGATFGKWLTGIRTVRSTLRPCGFARAVVRSAMYPIDFALLITPLPATISVILSPHRQRLGDRIADTLVIRSRQRSIE